MAIKICTNAMRKKISLNLLGVSEESKDIQDVILAELLSKLSIMKGLNIAPLPPDGNDRRTKEKGRENMGLLTFLSNSVWNAVNTIPWS